MISSELSIDQLKRLVSPVRRILLKPKIAYYSMFLVIKPHTTHPSTSMPYISARFHSGSDQLKRLASPVERSRPEGRIEWSDPRIRRDSDGQPWWDECPVKWYDNWLPHVKWFQNSSECETNCGPVQWTIGIRNWIFLWPFLQSWDWDHWIGAGSKLMLYDQVNILKVVQYVRLWPLNKVGAKA